MFKPISIFRANRKTRRQLAAGRMRQRGSLLLEGVLFLALLGGVFGIVVSMISRESRAQEETIAASMMRMAVTAGQNYVGENYPEVIADMFRASQTGGAAERAYSMQELSDKGYLPKAFLNSTGGLSNNWGQEFWLLVRAVDRSDSGSPQRTLTNANLDSDGDGLIDPSWSDGIVGNGEVELEAILVSAGGTAVPLQRGGPIVSKTGLPNAGMVTEPGLASGPYGSFSLDLSEYESFDTLMPEPGRFASIVAMSNFGVITPGADSSIEAAFLRCVGIDAATSAMAYDACMASMNNDVYNNLVFKSYQDNDGNEVFPAIAGLRGIACGDPIANAELADERILIDCDDIRIQSGDDTITISPTEGIQVRHDGKFSEVLRITDVGTETEFQLNADRIKMNGRDMATIVMNTGVASHGEEIPYPMCPLIDDGSGQRMTPLIYTSSQSAVDKYGRNVAGFGTWASHNSTNTGWRLTGAVFLNEDYCRNNVDANGNVIPIDGNVNFFANGAPDIPGVCTSWTGSLEPVDLTGDGNPWTNRDPAVDPAEGYRYVWTEHDGGLKDSYADAYVFDGRITYETRCGYAGEQN